MNIQYVGWSDDSSWLSKNHTPVDQEDLRTPVKARLETSYEEQIDMPLIRFDDIPDLVF